MDSAKVSTARKCRQTKAGERRQDQGEASVGELSGLKSVWGMWMIQFSEEEMGASQSVWRRPSKQVEVSVGS